MYASKRAERVHWVTRITKFRRLNFSNIQLLVWGCQLKWYKKKKQTLTYKFPKGLMPVSNQCTHKVDTQQENFPLLLRMCSNNKEPIQLCLASSIKGHYQFNLSFGTDWNYLMHALDVFALLNNHVFFVKNFSSEIE